MTIRINIPYTARCYYDRRMGGDWGMVVLGFPPHASVDGGGGWAPGLCDEIRPVRVWSNFQHCSNNFKLVEGSQ